MRTARIASTAHRHLPRMQHSLTLTEGIQSKGKYSPSHLLQLKSGSQNSATQKEESRELKDRPLQSSPRKA